MATSRSGDAPVPVILNKVEVGRTLDSTLTKSAAGDLTRALTAAFAQARRFDLARGGRADGAVEVTCTLDLLGRDTQAGEVTLEWRIKLDAVRRGSGRIAASDNHYELPLPGRKDQAVEFTELVTEKAQRALRDFVTACEKKV